MEPIRTTDPTGIDFRKKFELNDKVIIITGACGLVGRAFCEAVAQFGGIVVAADIELAKPEDFAAALSERNKVPAFGFSLDVASRSSVEALKASVLEKFGRIDGLVNGHQNKSHLKFEPFEQVSEDNWDTVIEVNLKGTFLMCQIIGSYMAENGGGSVAVSYTHLTLPTNREV